MGRWENQGMQQLTPSLFELRIGADLFLGLFFLVSISAYLRIALGRISRLSDPGSR